MPRYRNGRRVRQSVYAGFDVAPYNADVMRGFNLHQEDIPTDSCGVEIELNYTKALKRTADMLEKELCPHPQYAAPSRILEETAAILAKNDLRAVAKHDGSIGAGFEYATVPIPFKDVEKVARAYGDLLSIGGTATCRCGLHIHINRKAFYTVERLAAWTWLWSQYAPVLALSGRSESRLQRWAHPLRSHKLGMNRAVQHHGERRIMESLRLMQQLTPQEHHSSVCLRGEYTAELRVFAAPTSAAMARKRIELALATVEYVRTVQEVKDISWEGFFAWLKDHAAKFPHAQSYVASKRKKLLAIEVSYACTATFGMVYHPCTQENRCSNPIYHAMDFEEEEEEEEEDIEEDADENGEGHTDGCHTWCTHD